LPSTLLFRMSFQDEFVDARCTVRFLDKFIVRSSIVRALKWILPSINGTVLDVGCGRMPYRELLLSSPSCATRYIGLDLARADYDAQPDLVWDGDHIPLSDNAVECVLATEVFEHCPGPERVMCEIGRILKPGGMLFFTVPFLWPLHEVPYDEYRYTPFALERHLRNSGFERIQLQALGGWDASLAQMIGLWAARRPMRRCYQILLSWMALPFVCALSRMDRPPVEFGESTMLTGIYGRAYKPGA
jgi:SAM-dependent methyltransferase